MFNCVMTTCSHCNTCIRVPFGQEFEAHVHLLMDHRIVIADFLLVSFVIRLLFVWCVYFLFWGRGSRNTVLAQWAVHP